MNYGFGRWTDVQRAEAAKQGIGYRAVLFARLVGWSFILLLSILDSIPVQKASSYCIEYSEDLSCPSRINSLERSVTSSPDRIAPWFLLWIFTFTELCLFWICTFYKSWFDSETHGVMWVTGGAAVGCWLIFSWSSTIDTLFSRASALKCSIVAIEMRNPAWFWKQRSCKENLCNWVIVWRSIFLVFWSRGGCSLAVDVVGKRIMDVGTVRKLKDSEGWQCLNGRGCLFMKMPTLPLPALQSSLLLADVWRMCMTRILWWVPHYKTDDHCHHQCWSGIRACIW